MYFLDSAHEKASNPLGRYLAPCSLNSKENNPTGFLPAMSTLGNILNKNTDKVNLIILEAWDKDGNPILLK
jgi:hypothetical protein